ncbi:MAG: hypothetical protein PHF84_12140 [bacterium]|nr:hypothetical protein [bacterium]
MFIRRNKIMAFGLLLLLSGCGKDLEVRIDNNSRYLLKKMENTLVINLKSNKKKTVEAFFLLHNLTDDISDMPIFRKEMKIYPGNNVYLIRLKEIGAGKYSLRLMDEKDKLIDYRILEISSD